MNTARDPCRPVIEALRRLLEPLGLSPEDLAGLDIDPYGPRVIAVLEPRWAVQVVLDASPDGAELEATLEAPKGLDQAEAEAALEETVLEEARAVDEYDVAYDPEQGEAVITLHAAHPARLPRIDRLAEKAAEKLRELAGGATGRQG